MLLTNQDLFRGTLLLAGCAVFLPALPAQGCSDCDEDVTAMSSSASRPFAPIATAELPDAPTPALPGFDAGNVWQKDKPAEADMPPPPMHKFTLSVRPGQTPPRLSAGDKVALSLRRQVTVGALSSWLVSAGWSHLRDSRPHYGTDSAGFGERLGGAALRQTTQSFFIHGVFNNIFHDDPHYYILGPTHPFKKRVIYSATRVFLVRKDNGQTGVNYPLFAGVASAAALTNAYYPSRDRSIERTVSSTFSSLALRMGTNQIIEFSQDIRRRLHRKR
jgi:hypothetical protein